MGRSQVRLRTLSKELGSDNRTSVSQSEWIAEFEFRATGAERGSGNLHLWYAKDGPTSLATSSIYTVGYFDGFVLVVDPYGGKVCKNTFPQCRGGADPDREEASEVS